MRKKRQRSPYRIVGGRGEWFAWRPGFVLQGWWSHVARIVVFQRIEGWSRPRLVEVTAVKGRTPYEALLRLQRIERAVAC